MKIRSPYLHFTVIWILLALILAGILQFVQIDGMMITRFARPWIAANIATFLLFGLDKFLSKTSRTRVPEKILIVVSVFGGPIGSLGGMEFFRHKTRHAGLGFIIGLIALFQIVIIWKLIA